MSASLLLGLLGIALVDSINPSALVMTGVLLAGRDPYRRASGYVAGIACTYLAAGLAAGFGAAELLTAAAEFLSRRAVGFSVELVIGAALVLFGLRRAPLSRRPARESEPGGLGSAFALGVVITAVESTTALPYLGALTALVRSDADQWQQALAIVLYVAVFVSPPAVLVLLHRCSPVRAGRLLAKVSEVRPKMAGRPARAVTVLLGVVLVVDAAYHLAVA